MVVQKSKNGRDWKAANGGGRPPVGAGVEASISTESESDRETVEHGAGDGGSDQDGGGLAEADEAEEELVAGQVVDEPSLGGDADPDSGE